MLLNPKLYFSQTAWSPSLVDAEMMPPGKTSKILPDLIDLVAVSFVNFGIKIKESFFRLFKVSLSCAKENEQ